MRSGLLSDLAAVGYEISLEGDHVKLRYQKPGNPPESVRKLIAELREHKAEALAILKEAKSINPPYNLLPGANAGPVWPTEAQMLIDWFKELEPPAAPFYQEPHIHVIDPEKYFAALRREIAAGPASPRGRNGALLCDLNTLRKKLH